MSVQDEKEDGEDDEEEEDGCEEERSDREIDVEFVELRGDDGVDRGRRGGEDETRSEENGIRKEQMTRQPDKERDGEKPERRDIPRFQDIRFGAPEIDEESDREHGDPGADVDETLKDRGEKFRARDAAGVERKSRGHAEQADLVFRQEHFAEAECSARLGSAEGVFLVVILRHRENGEDEHDILTCSDNLRVGESFFII